MNAKLPRGLFPHQFTNFNPYRDRKNPIYPSHLQRCAGCDSTLGSLVYKKVHFGSPAAVLAYHNAATARGIECFSHSTFSLLLGGGRPSSPYHPASELYNALLFPSRNFSSSVFMRCFFISQSIDFTNRFHRNNEFYLSFCLGYNNVISKLKKENYHARHRTTLPHFLG